MTREIEKKSWEMMTGAQCVIPGCQRFDSFRAEVIASLPKDLPEEEFKRQLCMRIYGAPPEEVVKIVREGPEDPP